jgi:uncharacterized membrane protein
MIGYWPVTIFSGLTFGGRLLGFVHARRSLRRLARASLSEGHVVIEPTPAAGPRSCIRTEIARDLSPPERERPESSR